MKLRQGQGDLICLASDPKAEKFHVACYHRSLEPFMARGRALRARGVTGDRVDSVRFAEARAGKLRLPRHAAMLYSLSGPRDSFDPATGTAAQGAAALRGLPALRHCGLDRAVGQTGRGRALDHASGHAQGTHHVRAPDVEPATRSGTLNFKG